MSSSRKLIDFFDTWNKYISIRIAVKKGRYDLKYTAEKMHELCVEQYESFSKGPIYVEELKGSLEDFMSYEFTLGSLICDWRESISPIDLMGWLVILNRCPNLGDTYTAEMFLDGKYLETVGNPLKSEQCGCLKKGSCSSHLAMLGFMFNHTELTWQNLDKETMFFTPEEIEERNEADRKEMIEEED